MWVSRFDEEERWPSGEFCNQSRRDAGLPVWQEADRSVADTDVVLWHVFGIHHVPRPEDWPVMPVDVVSFDSSGELVSGSTTNEIFDPEELPDDVSFTYRVQAEFAA